MLPGLSKYESAGAEFDITGAYRYFLWREWGGGCLSPWRHILWIMLNPSTADANVLDPTLRRVEDYSRRFGFDGFEVVNLFAIRATDSKLLPLFAEPVGPENDHWIAERAEDADGIVVAWGANEFAQARAASVAELLAKVAHVPLTCLDRNTDGSPVHPLYQPKSKGLSLWP